MKPIYLLLLLLYAGNLAAQKQLIFLHNRWVEDHTLDEAHPDFGICEWQAITDHFVAAGFQITADLRPSGTDARQYAAKVVQQIDSLISAGTAPSDITVVGTSKGGFIAMFTSSLLQNPAVNFVFIGCCFDNLIEEQPDLQFCGRILSIFEESDEWSQSCRRAKRYSRSKISQFKELTLKTGLRHGFLFKAMPEWLGPTVEWAKAK
ncbi:MAG: alpha/beta hydrolase [Saprospiraceae bacterium]|nr:alpha/beta hydrolase [Saprospiraceae bacterium]